MFPEFGVLLAYYSSFFFSLQLKLFDHKFGTDRNNLHQGRSHDLDSNGVFW